MPIRTFGLKDKLDFGKIHNGSTVEHVLEVHPGYIEWCDEKLEWFQLKDDAKEALDQVKKNSESS